MNASRAARAPRVSVYARMAPAALSRAAARSRESFADNARRRRGSTSPIRSAENVAAAALLTISVGSFSAPSDAAVIAAASDPATTSSSGAAVSRTLRITANAPTRASSVRPRSHVRSTRARPGRVPPNPGLANGSAATSAAASEATPAPEPADSDSDASSSAAREPSSNAACSALHPPHPTVAAAMDAARSRAAPLRDPSAGTNASAARFLSAALARASPLSPPPPARPARPISKPTATSACASRSLAAAVAPGPPVRSAEAAAAAVSNHLASRRASLSDSSPFPSLGDGTSPPPAASPSVSRPTAPAVIPSSPPRTASSGAQSIHAFASARDHASASPVSSTRRSRVQASLAAILGARHAAGHHPPTDSVTARRWGSARHSARWSTTASLAVSARSASAASAWSRVGASPSPASAAVASSPGAIASGEHDGGKPSTRVTAAW